MQLVIAGAVVLVIVAGLLISRGGTDDRADAPVAAQDPAPIAVTEDEGTDMPPSAATPLTDAGTDVETDAAPYADGTYSGSGEYTSPAGPESVTITLSLEGGVVTNAEFTGHAEHPGSVANQAKFQEGYEELVLGMPIDEIELDVVNGSSLTPEGFMNALEKVKAEARV